MTFDYAIDSVASFGADPLGMVETDGEIVPVGDAREEGEDEAGDGETVYRSEVVARRIGDGVFPVEVLLVFEDGSRERRFWDGRARWRLFVHEGPSKLARAVVDPERTLLLDLDVTNNSLLREDPGRLGAVRWSAKWMIWLQDLLQTFTAFV